MATAGQLIVDTLAAHRIDRVFCVPGESYLGLLDPLFGRADVDTVVCRHEAGAGFMALADARMTGRPGVAMVSRGPGASNASIAVHTAQQDGVPFILFIGQVAARDVRRDSFQEIDYGHMFGKIAKWTVEVTDPNRMPETMLRAIQVATTGVPGPVVIAIPEDVLTAECDGATVMPQARPTAVPDASSIVLLRELLTSAKRPLVLAGSGIDSAEARAMLLTFLEAWNVPSVVSFRRQDLLPNKHPLYAGDLGLSNPATQMDVLRDCDLLLNIGARFSDITTQGYTYPQLVRPEMKLAHIHADPAAIGTHSDIAIACHPTLAIAAVGKPDRSLPDRSDWIGRLSKERTKISSVRTFDVSDGVPFEDVVDVVGQHLPGDAIVTVDAGTFGAPIYRVIPFKPPQRLLAPISGAMGFGVPAAVAAGLRQPDRTVVCFVGDGGFLMTGSELAVALERKLPLKVIVSENNIYGSIRIHQERGYPGRIVGTSFVNPDLELIGKAYGCAVTRISTRAEVNRIPDLLRAPGPQFIVVDTSIQAIISRPGNVREAIE
ncbi:thiamine pyrophosphate-binding protein [Bradyrhizobium sp.]|uniref:thiamine pyrophosphate-binding protein n=1 Tax=Bradyrhizobium sp. TaxID=376 RepID=UPI003C78CEAB